MKFKFRWILSVLMIVLLSASCEVQKEEEEQESTPTTIAVLSTTDMHGKCWHTNLLTNGAVRNNMLSISTAVRSVRETYGDEQVILIDNGDLFQGTPVSEVQLQAISTGGSSEPPAMALCLKEIGYDAFVLGNHEFNYDWKVMSSAYQYLEDNGVPVLAANAVWDGTDGVHKAGENAFTPYVIRAIQVNGHEHKIGILGLENCDISRWDLPDHYPGLRFVRPGNDQYSMSMEAAPWLKKLREEEGCEFIIVSYHSGLGEADQPLTFGKNTESQGLRLIRESEGIDLLILGHDHSYGYSNTRYPDQTGREVLVVNGGGQQLTQTLISFSEDPTGALSWQIEESRNLNPADYEPDPVLEQMMEPYVSLASEAVSRPLGTAEGEWDQSFKYYTRQTDTVDLIGAASITMATRKLQSIYDDPASAGVEGLDHLDVDIAMSSVVTNGHYVIRPGGLSMRDIYRLYRYANSLLVIPMRGSQIRAIMEENASNRLAARVLNGEVYFYNVHDDFTNLLFSGINFTYDMSAAEGERVQIEGFSNGRSFEDDGVYLAAVNNYLLGNERCGLRTFSNNDAIWAQEEDEVVQDLIADYVLEQCETDGTLTTEPFNWHWSIEYDTDPEEIPPYDGEIAARYVSEPEDGHTYIIMQESELVTMNSHIADNGLGTAACSAIGDILASPLDPEALKLTVSFQEDGSMALVSEDGLYLTGLSNGGLRLTQEMAEDGMSLWKLRKAYGGWNVICAGTDKTGSYPQALEFYYDHITTYGVSSDNIYVFNFYEIEDE